MTKDELLTVELAKLRAELAFNEADGVGDELEKAKQQGKMDILNELFEFEKPSGPCLGFDKFTVKHYLWSAAEPKRAG